MGIRDKSGSRSGSIHTSEHSLPEKLSQALKALRPGVLSQSSSGSSPFASKSSGVVDADDVIYYTGANNKMPFQEQNSYEKKSSVKGRIFGNTRKSKSVFTKHSSPSRNNDIAQFNLKSLDQIRHLYKSVPNVSSFDDGDEATPSTSRRCIDDAYAEIPSNNLSAMRSNSKYSRHSNSTKGLNADAFTATSSSMSSLGTSQSPTDSGYRSTPRHLFATGIDSTKPPPLPTNPPPLSSPEPFTYLPRKHSTAGRDDRLYDKSPAMGNAKKEIARKGSIYASTPVLVNSRKPSMCKTSPNLSPHAVSVSRKASIASDIAPVKLPIDDRDVLNVLQKGRCKQHAHFVTLGVVPKLTSSLTVPLLRICTEASRLAKPLVKCTMNDIKFATMLCLPESIAEECIKAAIQAITLYALSGTGALKVSMSRRSGLNFSVGNFYRWMIDSHVANVVTDTAAVYLCAVMECFLEKLLATLSGTIEKTESVTEENFDRLIADYLDVCRFLQAHEVKEVNKHSRKLKEIVCAQTEADLRTILDHLYRKIHSNSILFEQNRRRSKNALYFGKQAISSLFYFTRCKGRLCTCHIPSEAECEAKIYDWLRLILHFVDHRYGMHVDQQDVLQAARILLSNADCPPYSVDLVISSPSLPGYISETKKKRHDIGMALLLTSDSEFLKEAYNLLGPQKHKAFNDYGLTALSQAVITKNDEAVSFLIENNADVNAAIPPDNNSQSSALSNEFSGWSPLAWAVAFQDIFATNKLLEAGADVDEIYMVQETPLKIATMIGDSETFAKLISSGSNAFNTSKCYDSLQCTIRNLGSPSALAVAAAFGRREFVSIMLSQSRLSDSSKNDLSLTDFLSEYNNDIHPNEIYSSSSENNVKSSFKKLPKIIQKASQEAVYYAVETARSDIVMQFKQLGVPWNIYTWTKCLQVGYDNHDRTTMMNVLKDFSSRLIDELTADIVDDTVAILFDVIRYETRQSDGKPVVIAKIISKLNEKFSRDNSDSISQSNRSISVIESGTSSTSISAKPIIDPKYADNSELSDIRFKIEDKIIYAHRIVLVNASESFKRILDGPSGVIELDNITYDVFKVLINYMYGNRNICRQKMSENGLFFQLDIMEASLTFGLDQLTQECHDLINSEMSSESCSRIYSFAQRCGIQTLIEDAERYILQNFVTLMNNEQILLMLQRSGQPGWCDLCAALANRLVESFETFISKNKQI